MRETEITPSPDGYYRRNLGYSQQKGSGRFSQPKFNLGRVKRVAQERLEKIAAIWRRIELDAAEEEERPQWDSLSLEIAKAIGNGEKQFHLTRTCQHLKQYVQIVEATAKAYPEIRIVPADEEAYKAGKANEQRYLRAVDAFKEGILEKARYLHAAVTESRNIAGNSVDLLGGPALHEALDAYIQWIGQEKFDKSENATNDTGVTRQNFAKQLKTYLVPDRPLTALADFASVDGLFGILRKRPITHRYKKPMARKSASHLIGELARFFDWLHRSPDWDWRKPVDYEDINHRPADLESDFDIEAKEVPTYSVSQLRMLFHHATPLERLLLALGLNCGYGADQIGRLKIGEIHEKSGIHYIRRIRRKQKVRGIHRLFKITVEGLRWAIKGREDQHHAYVLINSKGNPLWRKTKGGRRCRDIANAWYRLLDRVCEHERTEGRPFPRYGFNSLRDTSSDMIRKIGGEEIASAHLTHKHQSADKNLRRYTNVPWKKVFGAQRRLEKRLATVFEGVENPWHDGKGNKGRKTTKKDKSHNGEQAIPARPARPSYDREFA